MNAPLRGVAVFAFCIQVTGCAAPAASPVATIPAGGATEAVVIGKSTKADVIAALGKTAAVRFDSGFEVWVYQTKAEGRVSSRNRNEYVILFAPSGIVAKTRIRPAPPVAAKG